MKLLSEVEIWQFWGRSASWSNWSWIPWTLKTSWYIPFGKVDWLTWMNCLEWLRRRSLPVCRRHGSLWSYRLCLIVHAASTKAHWSVDTSCVPFWNLVQLSFLQNSWSWQVSYLNICCLKVGGFVLLAKNAWCARAVNSEDLQDRMDRSLHMHRWAELSTTFDVTFPLVPASSLPYQQVFETGDGERVYHGGSKAGSTSRAGHELRGEGYSQKNRHEQLNPFQFHAYFWLFSCMHDELREKLRYTNAPKRKNLRPEWLCYWRKVIGGQLCEIPFLHIFRKLYIRSSWRKRWTILCSQERRLLKTSPGESKDSDRTRWAMTFWSFAPLRWTPSRGYCQS